MKVFSFSVFGDNPIYKKGFLNNIIPIKKYFPDWKIFLYVPENYDEDYIQTVLKENVFVFKMKNENYFNCTWRFNAIINENVDVMVCRDADSRVSERDFYAIEEWLNSGYNYNIIRDHPIGHHWSINAGMWGAKKTDFIVKIGDMLENFKRQNELLINNNTFDQIFLRQIIYPNIVNESLVHDEYFKYESHAKAINHDRKNNNFAFIGESIDENNDPRGDQRSPIISRYVNK